MLGMTGAQTMIVMILGALFLTLMASSIANSWRDAVRFTEETKREAIKSEIRDRDADRLTDG